MRKQLGFTLIELLIALALGLIITAAATLLFLTASKSQALQQGFASLQDDANFGLNYIVKDIRMGNLNTLESAINDQTSFAGIVFTSSANPIAAGDPVVNYSNLPPELVGNSVAANLLTRSGGGGNSSDVSNVNGFASDQLTIQYLPQYIWDDKGTASTSDDRWYGGFDCEGNRLEFTAAQGRHVIVQRYFLRTDTRSNANEPNDPLVLACDAGQYPLDGGTQIDGFGRNSQIILKRVDHFRVLFSIQEGENHRYVDANTYTSLASPRPRILAVQLGVLVRSAQAVGNDDIFKDGQVFQVLDQAVTVKTPTGQTSKYARQVVEQTIALRNTFGGRG